VRKVVQGFETEAVRIGGRHAPLGRLRRARAADINLNNRQELAAAPARADGLVCSQLCRHGIDVVADYLREGQRESGCYEWHCDARGMNEARCEKSARGVLAGNSMRIA
jgi:hypothetical protein